MGCGVYGEKRYGRIGPDDDFAPGTVGDQESRGRKLQRGSRYPDTPETNQQRDETAGCREEEAIRVMTGGRESLCWRVGQARINSILFNILRLQY